jgi:hypothetical protein
MDEPGAMGHLKFYTDQMGDTACFRSDDPSEIEAKIREHLRS